jgi:adenosylhomocysteine nucleosidase
LERSAFHRDGGPSGLFSALSWLFEICPDASDDALQHSKKRQPPSDTGGDVARSPIIAVTGLKMEAKLIAGPRVRTVSGGGDATGLVRALEVAVANKASAIISFGVAGGLKPGLAPGSKLVARSVITEDGGRYHGDPVWSQRLSVVLGGATIADIVGIDSPVVSHADKHALHIKTGAHAADMESHIAARIAAAHKLPFAAIRVVADPAHRQLPHAALVAIRPDGSLSFGAIMGSILRDPLQLSQLMRTAADARAALKALLRSRKLLAGTLGFHDFSELLLDLPVEDVLGGPLL